MNQKALEEHASGYADILAKPSQSAKPLGRSRPDAEHLEGYADLLAPKRENPASGAAGYGVQDEAHYLKAAESCPAGIDCSKFTQTLLKTLGHEIPRTAIQQFRATPRVDRAGLQPGDLVFFDNKKRDAYNTNGKKADAGYVNHVGLYLGNGKFIDDPGNSSDRRVPRDLDEYLKKTGFTFMGGGRVQDGRVQTGRQRQPVSRPAAQKSAEGARRRIEELEKQIRASAEHGGQATRQRKELAVLYAQEQERRRASAAVAGAAAGLAIGSNVPVRDPKTIYSAGQTARSVSQGDTPEQQALRGTGPLTTTSNPGSSEAERQMARERFTADTGFRSSADIRAAVNKDTASLEKVIKKYGKLIPPSVLSLLAPDLTAGLAAGALTIPLHATAELTTVTDPNERTDVRAKALANLVIATGVVEGAALKLGGKAIGKVAQKVGQKIRQNKVAGAVPPVTTEGAAAVRRQQDADELKSALRETFTEAQARKERGEKQAAPPPNRHEQAAAAKAEAEHERFVQGIGRMTEPEPPTKIAHPNGEPITVYHGTAARFRDFKKMETVRRIEDGEIVEKPHAGVFYFAESESTARMFAKDRERAAREIDGIAGAKGRVKKVQLEARNPLDFTITPEGFDRMAERGYSRSFSMGAPNPLVTDELAEATGRQLDDWEDIQRALDDPEFVDEVKAQGYDAVILREPDGGRSFGVFDPAQIRQVPQKRKATKEINKAPNGAFSIDEAAHEAATSPANKLPEPTAPMKEAGNYRKGHAKVAGLDVSIENPAGSKRRPEWGDLRDHYGYVRGTEGFDKDHLDVFIKPGTAPEYGGKVYVVNQKKADGSFDEHKAIVGYDSEEAAKEAYLSNYEPGWDRVGSVVEMDAAEFKAWATDKSKAGPRGGELKRAPLREGQTRKSRHESASDFARAAIGDTGLKERYTVGKVPPETAKRIGDEGGIEADVTGFAVRIDADRARHALKKHGADDLPVTPEDFDDVRRIIDSPDTVAPGSRTKDGKQSVKLGKRINGHHILVSAVHEKDGSLRLVTMYKRGKKTGTLPRSPDKGHAEHTPEAPGANKKSIREDEPDSAGLANQVQEREGVAAEKGKGVGPREAQAHGERVLREQEDPIAYAEDLARQIKDEARPAGWKETGVLLAGEARLKAQVLKARKTLDGAIGTPEHGDRLIEYEAAKTRRQAYLNDVAKAKTEASNTFRALQAGTDIDTGDYAEVIQEAERIKGADVPKADERLLKKMAEDLKETRARIAELEADAERMSASEVVAARRTRATKTKEQIATEREAAKEELRQALKKATAVASANPIEPFVSVSKALGKLAMTYVDEGLSTVEDIVAAIRKDYPEFTERQIVKAIAGDHGEARQTKERVLTARQQLVQEARDMLTAERKAAKAELKAALDSAKRLLREADGAAKAESMRQARAMEKNARLKMAAQERAWRAEQKALDQAERARIAEAKASGRRATAEERKAATADYRRWWRESIPGQRERIWERIERLNERLATGDYQAAQPTQVPAELKDLKAKERALDREIRSRIRAMQPRTVWDKVQAVGREMQLANPESRILDVLYNGAKLGMYMAQNPARSVLSTFAKGTGKERLITPGKLIRVTAGARKRIAAEMRETIRGADIETIEKYGQGSGFFGRLAGITDLPFRDLYRRLALEDYAQGYAAKVRGGKDIRMAVWRQLTEGEPGPLSADEVFAAEAMAEDWAFRQTYTNTNYASDVVKGLKNALASAKKEHPAAVGLYETSVDSLTRFTKVITNIALEGMNYTGLGAFEAAGRLAKAKNDLRQAGNIADAIPDKEARLIADLASRGLTGAGMMVGGGALYESGFFDNQSWIKGEIARTSGGTRFVRWSLFPGSIAEIDATQALILKPFLVGATWTMIQKSDLSKTQKLKLMGKFMIEQAVSQPLTGGLETITSVTRGDGDPSKIVASIAARSVIPGGIRAAAERIDLAGTGAHGRKSESPVDEFKKRIPVLRETLPPNELDPLGGPKTRETKGNWVHLELARVGIQRGLTKKREGETTQAHIKRAEEQSRFVTRQMADAMNRESYRGATKTQKKQMADKLIDKFVEIFNAKHAAESRAQKARDTRAKIEEEKASGTR